ncbi:hypothetical protein Y032_0601g512 [Ancylostoma ceylanicum]|uniref:Rad21/Rec8-like protein C-terminal eukaryotic domain-containing protein n=1 Tax=Ancylostoma ceylanicum TaxID=53326 RepID=A0A016WN53_9BILA|nr:hypothetical protein Y032_0601g512 [Ancylostoma ceylanicum]
MLEVRGSSRSRHDSAAVTVRNRTRNSSIFLRRTVAEVYFERRRSVGNWLSLCTTCAKHALSRNVHTGYAPEGCRRYALPNFYPMFRVRAAAARERDSPSDGSEQRNRRAEEASSGPLTPGRATLVETPNRQEVMVAEVGQGDVPERRYRSLPAELTTPAIPVDTLPLAADVTLPEYERFRESRSSVLEQARRMTQGTDVMEGRPSSVQLYDPIQLGDVSQLSSSNASGRLLSLSPSLREKIRSEECRFLMDAARGANRPIPLSSVIPHSTTSKKRAASVFSTLLYLVGKTVMEAKQYDPYGEIWVRACSATTSSDHDVDAMLSGGSIMS